MARLNSCSSILRNLRLIAVCSSLCLWLQPPLAWAQHGAHIGGAHAGGAGHFGGGPLGAAGVSAHPIAHPPAPLFRPLPRPPFSEAVTRYFRFPQQPPIYIFPHLGFHHRRYFNFAWGWGFNSWWWQNCNPFWAPGFSCSGFPQYGFGFGIYPTLPYYISPRYLYAGDGRELVQLYFNDGSAATVTDYWIVDGQIHFTTVDQGAPKPAEHVMNFDDLDLQKTIDVNTQRGFRFVLRNEPWQQYLKDHPDTVPAPITPPAGAPPETK
jgi:hypothetical protein